MGGVHRTLAEHWNGSAWKVQPTPNVGRRANDLASIDASSATSVWAVGAYDTSKTERTLAVHCC